MTTKSWLMVLLAMLLFSVYAVFFTDWFKPKKLEISETYRNLHPGPAREGVLRALIFRVTPELPLTEVAVVPFEEYQTNHQAMPLWHLTTDSNSIPMRTFFYGEYIRGMKAAIKGTHSEILETNVPYLIVIHARKITGQLKFELNPR